MGSGWAAFFAGLWASIKAAGPFLRDASLIAAGMVIEALKIAAAENGKKAEQYREVLEEERRADERPVAGAAERLRQSGYTTSDPDK